MISQTELKRAIDSAPSDSSHVLRDSRPRRRPDRLPGSGRIGAVMVLVYMGDPVSQKIVLTKRKHNLKHHPGQISLPGGRQDSGESLEMTSLRETQEEIGIEPERIRVLGALGQVYIPPSDYTITPYVGWCESPVEFVKSSDEVEEVILVDLSELLVPENLKFGPIRSEPQKLEASYFALAGLQIWGATAVVLNDLVEAIRHDLGT